MHHSSTAPPAGGGPWNTSEDIKKQDMVGDLHVPITPTLNNDMSLTFGHNDSKGDSLLPFSPDSVNTFSCPPLPPAPQVGLLPFDSALIGNILDNSSEDED